MPSLDHVPCRRLRGRSRGQNTRTPYLRGLTFGQTPPHHVDVKGSQREGITRFPLSASPHGRLLVLCCQLLCPFLPSAPCDHKPLGSGTELAGAVGAAALQTEELPGDNLLSGKGRVRDLSWGHTSARSCLDRVLWLGGTAGAGERDEAPVPLPEALGTEMRPRRQVPFWQSCAPAGGCTQLLAVLCLTLQNHHNRAISLCPVPDETELCRTGLRGSRGFGQEETPAGEGGGSGDPTPSRPAPPLPALLSGTPPQPHSGISQGRERPWAAMIPGLPVTPC